jgi:hypothetical protein
VPQKPSITRGGALLAQPGWAPGIILFGLAILLFPDGRPPSPRLRWMMWVYAAVAMVWVASAVTITVGAILGHHTQVDSSGNLLLLGNSSQAPSWWKALDRLFDIDRIISRTLAYAIVTGLLAGLYAGLVLLATQVFRFHAPVAVAASTLAVAALFTPVRRRVQRAVDRRFNRARYDAEQIVAAFAARLKDAVDLDSVRADLADIVHQVLEPGHVSVWSATADKARRLGS